jgi:acyl-CoA synthetase (AMP-forming)/AMP-acid ligase II
MLGYVGAAEDTAARFTPDGAWFLTGDTATMDADGVIRYLGRTDDMMNAGGFRVSPLEVEAALHDFPGLREIGVTDVMVKEDVALIAAFYVADTDLDPAALNSWAEARLARYKHPKALEIVDSLPRNPAGKVLKTELRVRFGGAGEPGVNQ